MLLCRKTNKCYTKCLKLFFEFLHTVWMRTQDLHKHTHSRRWGVVIRLRVLFPLSSPLLLLMIPMSLLLKKSVAEVNILRLKSTIFVCTCMTLTNKHACVCVSQILCYHQCLANLKFALKYTLRCVLQLLYREYTQWTHTQTSIRFICAVTNLPIEINFEINSCLS